MLWSQPWRQVAWHVIRSGPVSSFDPADPTEKKRLQRGSSFHCSDQYSSRYMVGTRGKGEVPSAANHIGFRRVRDAAASEKKP